VLASHARAAASLTHFFVWLRETVRTAEEWLDEPFNAFQPLLADPWVGWL
jgi:hypothetical protein